MRYYTNVYQRGNYLYVRGVDNGVKFFDKIEYHPTLWRSSTNDASDPWKTLTGETVYPFVAGNIRDTKEYLEQHEKIENQKFYSSPGHIYQYIANEYADDIKWNANDLSIVSIDIETEAERGFPDPVLASEELLLITVKDTKKPNVVTFGRLPFTTTDPNVKYVYCDTEQALCRAFLSYWQSNYPDVITGWNTSSFDLTYLYNRICKVLDETLASKLSPWGYVYQKEVTTGYKSDMKTFISGIASLDYLDLYKKFGTYSAKESYKLDYIAFIELGEKKLENPEPVFRDFYRNWPELFVTYNIKDVLLIDKLDAKMKLIDLIITIAYDAKINYEDVFSPVKTWDVIIYNYLNARKIVIPNKKNNPKVPFAGAYVKPPQIGKHKWSCSYDLNSLYPSLIMGYNMSPETISPIKLDVTVDDLVAKTCDLSFAHEQDLAVAGNGWCFNRKEKGLLPTLMQLYYDRRVIYKKEMLKYKQLNEDNPKPEYKNEITRYDNAQMAMKILLNSAYGAFGNSYFRMYDLRIAEGITLTGQVAIRWIENKLNALMNKTMSTTDVDYVILVDTDSSVLTMEILIEKVCPDKTTEQKIAYMDKVSKTIIEPYIDKSYEELALYTNAFESKLVMKRENLVDVTLIVATKMYAMSVYNSEGVQYKTPKLKVMGLQMVKSSTPSVVRDKLKELLPIVMYGEESSVQKYVAEFKAHFNELSAEDIAFPRSVSDITKYSNSTSIYGKGSPIQVRGALLYNHYITKYKLTHKYPLIQDGDKIKFIYLKTPNIIGENCIAFIDKLPEEFDLHKYVNYNLMFEKTFEDATQKLIESLNWSTEQKSTLEDWFL